MTDEEKIAWANKHSAGLQKSIRELRVARKQLEAEVLMMERKGMNIAEDRDANIRDHDK